MLNFLVWNQHKKNLIRAIVDIYNSERFDFIALIESQVDPNSTIKSLNAVSRYNFRSVVDPNPEPYFIIIYNDKFSDVQIRLDNTRVVIYQLFPKSYLDLILVTLHIPSKLRSSSKRQALFVRKTIDSIRSIEQYLNHDRTIVIGDFNLNPYDDAMLGADEFHTCMDLNHLRSRPSRIVHGDEFHHFYNPMWGTMGDRTTGPPGTYFYDDSSEYINTFWNTYDQVILRPSIANILSSSSPKIITNSKNYNFLDFNGRPDSALASDHLPIAFSLDDNQIKEAK
ncbi:MAG: endonuclease/exonuclease/phosphatase family protein [Fidelibacterota bacterium]|nr:MAG: endonuclease/exonuclease/phosphatase family protein [Candidatus Neomarinimicrobiota bacterium]